MKLEYLPNIVFWEIIKSKLSPIFPALDDVLARLHAPVNHGVAIAAARAVYA